MNKARQIILFAIMGTLATSCGSEQVVEPPTCATDPSLCPVVADSVGQFMASLPTWGEFAQPTPGFSNELNVAADTLPVEEHIVDGVAVFDDNGLVRLDDNVRFVCEAKPFTIQDTPEELVMYDPDRSILYAGGLIQGKSHTNPIGSLLGLPIAQRTPIQVSIPDLPTGANFRTVNPTLAEVEGARGDMIGNAVADNLATPSSSNFTMESYYSEKSFALSARLSGKYLGFSAKATGDLSRSVGETTVTAHFTEAMYTVAVEPPQTPDSWFTEEFNNERLAEQISLGRMGPDNIPVYISEIVYGRSMMFSVTSTASESDIRASMQASYDNLVGSVNGGVSSKQTAILENSKIAITSLGGSSDATSAMIRTGDWAAYFENSVALSQAVPISYTLRNLVGDGAIAAVTEATEYTITTCSPKPLVPGVFDFDLVQGLTVPLTPGYQTLIGDFNNDQRDDLLFNYRSGAGNHVSIALAQIDRTYAVQDSVRNTEQPAEGWSLYEVHVGDFNNDNQDDIIWNKKDAENVFYVGLSNGDGTFQWGPRVTHQAGGWGTYQTIIADVDGANGDDIVWNVTTGSQNRTYIALSLGDGTFDTSTPAYNAAGTASWGGTRVFVDDVNGDGTVDLMFNRITNNNDMWVAPGNRDGTFGGTIYTRYGVNGWGDYKTILGNFNNTSPRRADLFLIADNRSDVPIHRARGNGNYQFDVLGWQHVPDSADNTGPFEIRMGDVDADGDDDVIFVDLDSSDNKPVTSNNVKIWVGLGTEDELGNRFDFGPIDQTHPSIDSWNQYEVFVADVNADNKADIILSWNTSPHNVYVIYAK